jgi:hypothetical protein
MAHKKRLYTWLALFLIASICHVGAQSPINIVKNGISRRDALYEVEKQSKCSVGFDETDIDVNKTISLSLKDASLEDALKEILKGDNYTFTVKNRHIIITRNSLKQEPQKGRTLRGRVTDEKGEPLVGVTLLVEGTNIGTTTDYDGTFILPVNDESAIISISYVGFINKKVWAGNNSFLEITLEEDNKTLEELVVIGYNSVRKKDLTTSVAVIRGHQ